MKRLAAAALVALTLALPASAQSPATRTEIKTLMEPLGLLIVPGNSAKIHVGRCSRSMRYCWVKAYGTTVHCNALVKLNVSGNKVSAWAPRLRCRQAERNPGGRIPRK